MVLVVFNAVTDEVVLEFDGSGPRSFEQIYLDSKDRLFRVLLRYVRNRETALELLQETFLRTYRHAHDLDKRKDPYKYMVTIAINLAIDWLRKEEAGKTVGMEQVDWRLSDGHADFTRELERRELDTALEQALPRLADHERMVIELKMREGMTYSETAATMGISLRSAKRYLKSGLEHLAHLLREAGYAAEEVVVDE